MVSGFDRLPQRGGRVILFGGCGFVDADADRDGTQFGLHGTADPFGECGRSAGGDAGEQEELFPTEADEDVIVARVQAQHIGETDQQGVPGGVPL